MSRSLTELALQTPGRRSVVTRTTRLDREVDSKLVEIADKDEVSINTLVNKALRRHVEWDARADKFGFMCVPTSIMAKIFDCLTEEEARELGTWSGDKELTEMVNFWFMKLDLDSSFKLLNLLSTRFENSIKFVRSSTGEIHTIILKHDLGPNASIYYSEQLKGLFEHLGYKVETMETPSQVVAKITS
jgi:hypothetical protein